MSLSTVSPTLALSSRPSQQPAAARGSLPAGIGLRPQHHEEIIVRRPPIGWFEVHSENYFARGGAHRAQLARIRGHYLLSLHGVGLSLGSTDPLNAAHLRELDRLVRDLDPVLVSEHLSWSSVSGRYVNDLLPLPYTEEALRHMAARVRGVQDALGRQILIENISSYLRFSCAEAPEWEFLAALAEESGCGILLDINNLYVSAMNHGFDPLAYLHGIPRPVVKEFHLAGHTVTRIDAREIRIDTHNTHVADEVWTLYGAALQRFGSVPTLIEWDADIPALEVLQAEAAKADWIAEPYNAVAA
jgi:uncharacterized protein (UPF0276 family)